MNRSEWTELAAIIGGLWRPMPAESVEAWWRYVKHLDRDDVLAAVDGLAGVESRRPSLAELLESVPHGGSGGGWQAAAQAERAQTAAEDDPWLGPRTHLDHAVTSKDCEVCRRITRRHMVAGGEPVADVGQTNCTSCGGLLDVVESAGWRHGRCGGCGQDWASRLVEA